VDYDFFGHQVSLHLVDDMTTGPATNRVDGDDVPVRHFGVILPREDWSRVAERCRASGLSFLVAPRIRFEGTAGEQGTFFVRDPSGNALEFKTFADHGRIFAVDEAAI
jgi:extradiol dioxygenase family protein